MYKKARAGQIAEFTGISSPYEAPVAAELVLNTGATELDVCVRQILGEMTQRGVISGHNLKADESGKLLLA